MALQELTDRFELIQKEYSQVSERISKLQERRESVSEKVFSKVYQEYLEKQASILEKAKPDCFRAGEIILKAREIINEKKQARAAKQEAIEEFELRLTLGEFDEPEFEKLTGELKNDIADLDSDIDIIQAQIDEVTSYLDLFSFSGPASESDSGTVNKGVSVSSIHEDETLEDETLEDKTLEDKTFDIDEEALLEGIETIDEADLMRSFSSPSVTISDRPEIALNMPRPDPPSPGSSQASGHRAQAVLEKIKNSLVEKIIPLAPDETAIGRGNNNDLVLLDRTVSREHALISLEPDGYILTDLNSTRGTFINGVRCESKLLEEGDEIIIGSMIFRFKYKRG
jgi:hypothetical protein